MAVSIIGEYKKLLHRKVQIDAELPTLTNGYISKKIINGKAYSYLQSRVSGKLTSMYLKSDEIDTTKKEITLRKQYETEQLKILARLEALEQAAYLLDMNMSRELMLLKASAGMDYIDSVQKQRSASFASAMNAIEGVAISEQTAQDLSDWRQGTKSFLSIFKTTLQRYGFASEVK